MCRSSECNCESRRAPLPSWNDDHAYDVEPLVVECGACGKEGLETDKWWHAESGLCRRCNDLSLYGETDYDEEGNLQ